MLAFVYAGELAISKRCRLQSEDTTDRRYNRLAALPISLV